MKLFMSMLIFFSSLFLAFVSLEGKRGLEEGRSLYTYAAVVFYLLYICFGMEEGTFFGALMYVFVCLFTCAHFDLYIGDMCVLFGLIYVYCWSRLRP